MHQRDTYQNRYQQIDQQRQWRVITYEIDKLSLNSSKFQIATPAVDYVKL